MNAIVNIQPAANELTVEAVFSNITYALRRSTEGVLEAAKCLVQFEGYKEFCQLKKQLELEKVMAKSTISQYMTIGKCTVLNRVVDKLPPSFNSIYHLARLEKESKGFIERQIADGKLTRATKLEDIRSWGEGKPADWIPITIEVDAHVEPNVRDAMKRELIQFLQSKGLNVKPYVAKKAEANKGAQQ